MTAVSLVRRIRARPAMVPPERVVMSWRWKGGQEDPGESRLEIRLKAIPGGTELTLTHALLHDEETRLGHEQGWSGALEKLVAQFATGGAPL